MSENRIGLIDRLQERGLIDRWGFMTFAVVGSFGIVLAKYWALETVWIAGGALALMLTYAVIVNLRGSGKLRSDQAGDNCYYLGLIYTLSSLAFAIFTFDPANTATTIVQGFGIALATTIFGLVLRVFFNQSRVDLYEAEETARLELTEAAARIKTQLSQVALAFKDFSHGLQQSVSEVRDAATLSIESAASASIETVRALADEVSASIAQHAGELNEQAGVLAKTTRSVAGRLEKHADSIDELTAAHAAISRNVGAMYEASELMTAGSATILEHTTRASQIASSTQEAVLSANGAAATLQGSLSATVATLRRFESEFAERLKALEDGPRTNADAALTAIANTARSVEAAMERILAAHAATVSEASQNTASLVTKVAAHNAELEGELSSSRERIIAGNNSLLAATRDMIERAQAAGPQ